MGVTEEMQWRTLGRPTACWNSSVEARQATLVYLAGTRCLLLGKYMSNHYWFILLHTEVWRLYLQLSSCPLLIANSRVKERTCSTEQKYKGSIVIHYFHLPRTYSPPLFRQKVGTNKIYYLLLCFEMKRVLSLETELEWESRALLFIWNLNVKAVWIQGF